MGTGGGAAAGIGGAALGAATGGIGPLLIAALMSGAPGLLQHLFGKDPQKELQKKMMELLAPKNQAAMQNQFYQQNLASPAYAQAQGTIAAGANAGAGQLSRELGARGIGTSGTGAILSSLTPSIVGSQLGQLKTSAYNAGTQQAQQTLQDQLRTLQQTGGQPSATQQQFAGGLDAFGPLLQKFLAGRGGNWASIFGNQ
jgi:hypothetical protein